MDAEKNAQVREKVARSVQHALRRHEVSPENLGETANFLCHLLGGMIEVIFPKQDWEKIIQGLREEIDYGIEMGIPEE